MSNLITNTKFAKAFSGVAVAGFLTFALMLGGVLVAPSSAQAITQAEATAIITALGLTGSQAAVIQALVSGSTGGSTGGTGYVFTTTLKQGSTGSAVMELQKALNKMSCCQVSASGAGSPGSETSYFGAATKAAVVKFQNAYASDILTPIGLTSGTGLFGPASMAKMNALNASTSGGTTNPPPGPVTGTVSVSLAPTSPMQGAVIAGQGIANMGEFTFANGVNAETKITKVIFKTTGISNDTAYNNVYLYQGGARLTDAASVTNGVITFNDSAGLFTLAANSSKTVSVRVDVLSTATGQVMGVSLTGAESNVPAAGTAVSGVFPINGASFAVAAATLSTADFGATTEPSATANVEPTNDQRLWQNTVSISQHAVDMKAISFRNTGSAQSSDIINFDLYVDGTLVASTPSTGSNGYVSFDFSNAPKRLESGSHVIKLEGDVVSGASRTFDYELRTTGDVFFEDSQLKQPVVPTANSTTFSSRSGAAQTIASSTGGSVTVSKASTSQSSNVSTGASSVKLATFELRGSGERMKIESLYVNANTSADSVAGGLDNAKVFVNGAQVGSTKDLSDNTDTQFTFGSSFIIDPGQTAIVDIYADTKGTTGTTHTSGSTVLITLDGDTNSGNAQGMNSLQTKDVPTSDVAANTVTMSSAALTATKYTAYGNQTRPAGTSNFRVGSFVLSSGSTEGANVNNITLAMSATEAASITNMMLKDNATGAQIGTTIGTPSTSNSYSVNFTIPQSGTKVIDIYANIISGAGIGDWQADFASLTGTAATTGTTISYDPSDINLQTITIGSGTLTLSKGAGDPSNSNIVAGTATPVKVGEYRFSAANSSFTVDELKIEVANGVASSVDKVVLEYKNELGVTQTKEASLTLTTPATNDKATATFTGLGLYVPANGDGLLTVKAKTVAISGDNAALSGQGINVNFDFDTGFKATAPGQTPVTSVGSADIASGGTHYLKKSIPTFAKVALTGSLNSSDPIYRFKVTADAAGSIEMKKITFNISTTGVTLTGFYLRETGDATNINDSLPDGGASGVTAIYAGTQTAAFDDDVLSVAQGDSKSFDLFATTIAGWSTNDSVSISLGEDTSANIANTTAIGQNAYKLIWSDRSRSAHTTATADWSTGYLLKDFSSDTQSWNF